MHPVLPRRGIGHLLKAEPWSFGPHHREELAGKHLLDLPVELLGPPAGQLRGVAAVKCDHLYVERHTADFITDGDDFRGNCGPTRSQDTLAVTRSAGVSKPSEES